MRFMWLFPLITLGAAPAIADNLRDSVSDLFTPLSADVVELSDNALTPEKISLGAKLFKDANLSDSGFFACASCHNPAKGGADGMDRAIGHTWQDGSSNTPSIFNSVFNTLPFWDQTDSTQTAREGLDLRAGIDPSAATDRMIARIRANPSYADLFRAAFPDAAEPISFETLSKALEAYQATLVTPAPFDAWLNGDDNALNAQQRAGLSVFVEVGCAACHSGINLGGDAYYPFGLVEKPDAEIAADQDESRYMVADSSADGRVFRASPLRNITLTAPYFHSGKVWDLKRAVTIMAESQLGAEVSEAEVDQIVEFLHAVEGERPVE